MRLLLQSPVPPLCWRMALVTSGASELVPQLQSLPDLTELDVECLSCDVDFVLSLPRVVNLCLHQRDSHDFKAADVMRIVSTLQLCPNLTALKLANLPFTSEQLATLLPALPRLTNLNLTCLEELTSLHCIATEALATSLTSLCVWGCSKLPAAETVHLFGLRRLSSLCANALREPLSEEQTAQLQAAHPLIEL